MMRLWLVLGGLLGALAVVLDAMTSHGPVAADPVAAGLMAIVVRYLGWHAVTLLALAVLDDRLEGLGRILLRVAGLLLMAGLLLFCGSLASSALRGATLFPMAAPAGGMALIAGWLALALAGLLPGRPRPGRS